MLEVFNDDRIMRISSKNRGKDEDIHPILELVSSILLEILAQSGSKRNMRHPD